MENTMTKYNMLTVDELEKIDGGIIWMPLLIGAGKIFIGSAITGFAATAIIDLAK